MIIAALLFSAQAVAAETPNETPNQTIIVTTPANAKAELIECIARGCPPAEEIAASIRYGDRLFVAGRYREGRLAIKRAIERNKHHAAELPLLVSALYQGEATLAQHDGDLEVYERSTLRSRAVLRDTFEVDSAEALTADLRVGDMHMSSGRAIEAERTYARVGDTARQRGYLNLAGHADLRRAWALHRMNRSNESIEILRRISEFGEPSFRPHAATLEARIGLETGDESAAKRAIAMIGDRPATASPLLLSAPTKIVARRDPIDKIEDPVPTGVIGAEPIRWADIGFWIRPDGSTAEVGVLRGSNWKGWAEEVVVAIGRRRYAALSDSDGQFRVERFSYSLTYGVPIGSLIRRRVGVPVLRSMDITHELESLPENGTLPAEKAGQ